MPQTPLHRPPSATDLDRARRSTRAMSDAVSLAKSEAGDGAFVLAWMSDLHLHAPREYGELSVYATTIDASTNTTLAFTEMLSLAVRPDLLIFGGDIADSGCGGEAPHDEYAEFQRLTDVLLPAELPSLPVLGNHDHADVEMTQGLHKALARHGRRDWPVSAGPLDFYHESRRGGWRFIALDSRQGHDLGPHQLAWFSERIAADPHTPTVVMVHRPWTTVGNWVDNHRQKSRATFEAIDSAPCVKAVLSGHTHKSVAWDYRRKTHIIFPSVAYGIGQTCGWGLVVLGREGVHAVFTKEITGETYEHPSDSCSLRAGDFRRLPPEVYTRNQLFDPCLLPR